MKCKFNNFLLRYLPVILFLISINLFAQKQGNIWYFGQNAGVNFNSGSPPSPLANGALNTYEGCATICDVNGNLLFYTDGINVWDKNHGVMPNGTGLLGNPTSSQSSIIIPKPGTCDIYYIFTVGSYYDIDGLNYSEVDMSLPGNGTIANPLGNITANKNIHLAPVPPATVSTASTTEKVTAVRHANLKDIWVITSQRGSNAFYAFYVSSAGVNTTPVISNVGSVNTMPEGYLKASPNGGKIAMGISYFLNGSGNLFELFDFDNSTGILSNPITFTGYNGAYGVEFSPDGSRLYGCLTQGQQLWQFNLQAGTPTQIINSATLITSFSTIGGAIQLGPDGKIYHSQINYNYLGVINNPNALGLACNFVLNGVYLGTRRCSLGLPNTIPFYITYSAFTWADTCFGDSTTFSIIDTTGVNSVFWDFDDPNSAPSDTSTLFYPFHIFSAPGKYKVRLITYHCGISDTAENDVTIHPLPTINLGNDSSLCRGDTIILYGNGGGTYIWSNNVSTDSIIITPTINTTYIVTVTLNGCTNSDDIIVTVKPVPTANAGINQTICNGMTTILGATGGGTYYWNIGATTDSITISPSINTTYTVTVTLNGCTDTDDVIISLDSAIANAGQDVSVCLGDSKTLNATGSGTYVWNTGNTTSSITVQPTVTTTYTITVNKGPCIDTDEVILTILPLPTVNIGEDTTICYRQHFTFDAGAGFFSYLWQNGSTNQTYTADIENYYWVRITDANGCIDYDTAFLNVILCDTSELWIPNAFTPNGDGNNDIFKAKGAGVLKFNMYIYDRWGELLFESDNKEIGWDGKYKGNICKDGVYSWLIFYEGEGTGEQVRVGMVVLLH